MSHQASFTSDDPQRAFAIEWIASWNRRDLEAILSHYADGVRMSSPFASVLTGSPTVHGLAALRAYWAEGLARRPKLRFELIELFTGADSLSIYYRDETGRRAVETMFFDEHRRIAVATACYDHRASELSASV